MKYQIFSDFKYPKLFQNLSQILEFYVVSPDIRKELGGGYKFPIVNVAEESWRISNDFQYTEEHLGTVITEQYWEILFVHEIFHAFRNFLNHDLDKLFVVDHGLMWNYDENDNFYVPADDFIVELEVLALEYYCMLKSNKPEWYSKLFDRLEYFTSRMKEHIRPTKEEVENIWNDRLNFWSDMDKVRPFTKRMNDMCKYLTQKSLK
jgi:hypothetical protein